MGEDDETGSKDSFMIGVSNSGFIDEDPRVIKEKNNPPLVEVEEMDEDLGIWLDFFLSLEGWCLSLKSNFREFKKKSFPQQKSFILEK